MTAVIYNNSCRYNATSGGTGDFVVASHVTGYKTPIEAKAINGKGYHYYAQSADGLQWEDGNGIYSVANILAYVSVTQVGYYWYVAGLPLTVSGHGWMADNSPAPVTVVGGFYYVDGKRVIYQGAGVAVAAFVNWVAFEAWRVQGDKYFLGWRYYDGTYAGWDLDANAVYITSDPGGAISLATYNATVAGLVVFSPFEAVVRAPGGYFVGLRHQNGTDYTAWNTDASGVYLGNVLGVVNLATYTATKNTYALPVSTQARTTISRSSNLDGSRADFNTLPIVDMFPSPESVVEDSSFSIPSGTLMLFQQTAAPVGWTKQTTHNDKALRVVSGTASSGGNNSFSGVMAQTVVGNTTISTSTLPAHTHNYQIGGNNGFQFAQGGGSDAIWNVNNTTNTDNGQGAGGAHTHGLTLAILYVDVIIASKD